MAEWPERNTFKEWRGHRAVAREALDAQAGSPSVYSYKRETVEEMLVIMAKCVGDEIIGALTSYFHPSNQREYAERMIKALREPGTGKPGRR